MNGTFAFQPLNQLLGDKPGQYTDWYLISIIAAILGYGLVMVGSASVGVAESHSGDSAYYFTRQLVYITLGISLAYIVKKIPMRFWERSSPMWLVISLILLCALFIPGIGKTVNGSTRWLLIGPFNLQVSELAKAAMILYLSGYLVRKQKEITEHIGYFLRPMVIVGIFVLILLREPDFGAAVIITATVMGMMFLAGVRLWLFGSLLALIMGAMALLAIYSPYRMERLTAFLNPWADPFNSGFQLTQALIAFGRGEWIGVGLGSSVQKLFYLPEAHTDFVFAVLAEELGMLGASLMILLFVLLVGRIFWIGERSKNSGNPFGAYACYGVAIWISIQAFINMGVNMGLLPTKGLTLPLVSYGGSSMLVMCCVMAIVLRVYQETPQYGVTRRKERL
jgi:cell division protein FtsW